jgi:hypothetical protein
LDSPGELLFWRGDASRAKVPRQISFWPPILILRLSSDFPDCSPATDVNSDDLQIPTALIHRELPAIDGDHIESMKKRAMNNIKRFSHHRGKEKTRQNAETQFWNELISEFADNVAIKVLDLISERIQHLGRKKETGMTDFIDD